MSDGWMKLYTMLDKAGCLRDFSALLKEHSLYVAHRLCTIGEPDDVRRDVIAEMRFCLGKSDEAGRALAALRGQANPQDAGGFPEGGSVPA